MVKKTSTAVLLGFSLSLLFVFLSDSAIAYLSPVVIERSINSVMIMGFILSWSSVVGMLADIAVPKFLSRRPYQFYVRALLVTMLTFPLCFLLLPHQSWVFLLAMSIWGLYFEFLRFAEFTFIHSILPAPDHAHGWGVFETTRAVGYVLGPIVGSFLLDRAGVDPIKLPFLGVLLVLMLAVISYRVYELVTERWLGHEVNTSPIPLRRSFWQELLVWKSLMSKIWVLYLFLFALVLIDTVVWSVGALLMNDLRQVHWIGGLLLAAYSAPSLGLSLVGKGLGERIGKKRVAFGSAVAAGLTLLVGAILVQSVVFVGVMFIAASFLAIGYPLLLAVFEDYMARLDTLGSDLVGLEATATNVAYIIGPAAAGVLAGLIGNYLTIAVFGGFLTIVSVIALIIVPRKIRLPQQELQTILAK